jgi:hypothetical protein
MADFTLTVVDATRVITTAPDYTTGKTAGASSNNYYIPNNGRVVVLAAATTTATVTVVTPNSVDGNAIADLAIALPGTDVYVLGPFPQGTYNDAQGRILITVSAACALYPVRI